MARCSVCNSTYSMKKCGACNSFWCMSCARKGKGHYPKQGLEYVCPYCGTSGKVSDLKDLPHKKSTGQNSEGRSVDELLSDLKFYTKAVLFCAVAWVAYHAYVTYLQPIFSNEEGAAPNATLTTHAEPLELPDEKTSSIALAEPALDSFNGDPTAQPAAGQEPEVTTDTNIEAVTPPSTPTPPVAPSLTEYDVTTSRDQSIEIIAISAKDESDARRIIRDFRGNPDILQIVPRKSKAER